MTEERKLSIDDEKYIEWTGEKVEKLPSGNGVYKLACLILGKKRMTYRELYLIAYGVKKKELGEEKAKELAVKDIIRIYEYNNGHLPPGIEKEK